MVKDMRRAAIVSGLALWTVLWSAAGCEADAERSAEPDAASPTDGGGEFRAGDAHASETPGGGDAASAGDAGDGQAELPPDLSGTWAHLHVKASVGNYPMVGPVDERTTTLYRATLTQDGERVTWVLRTCAVLSENTSGLVQTFVPERLIDSLPEQTASARLTRTAAGFVLERDRLYELQGVRLEDVENEALPTSADDPRVYDQDGDGQPGVTVMVSGLMDGSVYVIQRLWTALAGLTVGADTLDGPLSWHQEQNILGADPPGLAGRPESQVDPDPSHSYVRTTRIAAELDCAAIVANRDTLFAR